MRTQEKYDQIARIIARTEIQHLRMTPEQIGPAIEAYAEGMARGTLVPRSYHAHRIRRAFATLYDMSPEEYAWHWGSTR